MIIVSLPFFREIFLITKNLKISRNK